MTDHATRSTDRGLCGGRPRRLDGAGDEALKEPISTAAWWHDADGLAIEPIYNRRADAAVIAGMAAARPWEVTVRVDHPDRQAASTLALADLKVARAGSPGVRRQRRRAGLASMPAASPSSMPASPTLCSIWCNCASSRPPTAAPMPRWSRRW
jgi:hypothetical protein